MVVIEKEDIVRLFDQHEHARLCGEFAKVWRDDLFIGKNRRSSVVFGIYEHDNGWIELDQRPKLNQEKNIPYSFIDYPLQEKLQAYTKCINRVSEVDDYAALLCSLHYSSFFSKYTNGRGGNFLLQEYKRQKGLIDRLHIHSMEDKEALSFHYKLLQFCDHLSLYLCMNEPGIDKEGELIWFRKGFTQTFTHTKNRKMIAHWLDEETVSVSDFPFEEEITVSIPYKEIRKNDMHQLETLFAIVPTKERTVKIVAE